MKSPTTNRQFAKAVCAELGIDPCREGAPLCSVDTETSDLGGLTKITLSFYVGYGLVEKIGQRMVADAAAEIVIKAVVDEQGADQP